MISQKLREYEIVVILSPDASEAEVEQSHQSTAEFISGRGGSVGETDNWGSQGDLPTRSRSFTRATMR